MNFLHSADWSFPIPIYYGPGRINDLPGFCKKRNIPFYLRSAEESANKPLQL